MIMAQVGGGLGRVKGAQSFSIVVQTSEGPPWAAAVEKCPWWDRQGCARPLPAVSTIQTIRAIRIALMPNEINL